MLPDSKKTKLESSDQEACKPNVNQIILNCTTFWSLALRIFVAFIRILLITNLSLNQTLLTFLLCVRLTWMTQLWQILCERLSSFNLKRFWYSYAWSRSLCEARTSLCMGTYLQKTLQILTCFRFALLHSVSYFFFPYRSLFLSLWTIFDSISSNIDEVLSINPSTIVFVFRDFNVHHKDWLTYSGGTDRPGELWYNFSISNDLTQMVNISSQIPDCDCHSPALLDLFISPDTSICSTMTFPPLRNSDHVVSVSIDFPSNWQRDAPFHRIAYDYSCADLRDIPWKDIFKLDASVAASEFLCVGSCCNWCIYPS